MVMKCSWTPINTPSNATVKQDEYGFWMVNHGQRVLGHVEPYVLLENYSFLIPNVDECVKHSSKG